MNKIYNETVLDPCLYDPVNKMPIWINLAPCRNKIILDNYHKVSDKLKCYRKYSCEYAIILVGEDKEADFIYKIYIGSSDVISCFYFYPRMSFCKMYKVDDFELNPYSGKAYSLTWI